MEQLNVQITSAKVAMARLSSPLRYYVLSGNDFTLDINNGPAHYRIACYQPEYEIKIDFHGIDFHSVN